MATIPKGILGPVNGGVGTIVGSSWKGIDYIRSKSGPRKSGLGPAQQLQAAKFSLVAGFLSTIMPLLKFSFRDFAKKMTGRNHALAYMLKNAVTGEFPDLQLDYSMVLVSRGNNLPNTNSGTAVASAPGVIGFSWQDNSGVGSAQSTDKAILIAHAPSLNQSAFISNGPARSTGVATLSVPGFSGKQVHTWLAFISEDGKDVATSVYTGMVNVQ